MPESNVTKADIDRAVDLLATLKFFPRESGAQIALQLAKMMPHRRALDWTISAVIAATSEWPSLQEIRGVLCSRFSPADGIDAWSRLPGHSAGDGEQRSLEAHAERQLLEAGPIHPSSLEILKQIGGKA